MAVITLENITTATSQCPVLPDGAEAITPSDVDTFSSGAMIYVGGAGNVTIRPNNGSPAVTFSNMPAGSMVPCRAAGVNATGTTATNLVAVF